MFLKISQNSQENTCAWDSATGVSCEFCEIFKNSFFILYNTSGGWFWSNGDAQLLSVWTELQKYIQNILLSVTYNRATEHIQNILILLSVTYYGATEHITECLDWASEAAQLTSTCSKSTTETKKYEKCSKLTIKTPERLLV